MLYSGIILDLIKDPIYPKVIKVYATIKRFNESLEYMSKDDLIKEMNEIILQIEDILKQ